jgi:hypothetical protein
MPWVDSINIRTYVNLEFQTDFVVDAVKNIVNPLQNRLDNAINHMDIKMPNNFDLRKYSPKDIEINISKD